MLDLLPLDEATDLFAAYYGRGAALDLTPAERAAAEAIVFDLGRHTLAVKLAAAYARDAGRDLGALAVELANPARALALPEHEVPGGVQRSFQASVDALAPDTRRLFAGLGAFATNEFGRQAALALAVGLGFAAADAETRARHPGAPHATAGHHRGEPARGGGPRAAGAASTAARASARALALWSDDARAAAQRALAEWYADYVPGKPNPVKAADEANITGALEWARAHGEDLLTARLCWGLAEFWRNRGKTREALQHLPTAIEAAERVAAQTNIRGDRVRVGNLVTTYGTILTRIGQLDEAERYLRRALEIDREVQDRRGEGVDLTDLGQIARARGRLDEAAEYFQQGLAIDREVRDRRGEGVDLSQLGQIALARGRLDEAAEYFQQSLAIRSEVRDRQGEGVVLANLGQIAQARGQLDEAVDFYEQSLAIRREVQDRQGEGVVLSQLGQIAQARGQLDAAIALYEQGLVALREVQDRRGEGVILYSLALIAEQQGDLDRAETLHRDSLSIAIEVQSGRDIADSYSYLGTFLITKRQQREEGCGMLAEAARLYDEMGMPGGDRARATALLLGCGKG